MDNLLLALYFLCSFFLIVYGLHCYIMIILFLTKEKKHRINLNKIILDSEHSKQSSNKIPFVTIQLPIYNEAEVAIRLIESATNINYP